ncbi:hypothetical protein GBAR_LOCUS28022, partial [Geodia barretti]
GGAKPVSALKESKKYDNRIHQQAGLWTTGRPSTRRPGGTPRRRTGWPSRRTPRRAPTRAIRAQAQGMHLLRRAHKDHRLQGHRQDSPVRIGPGEDMTAPYRCVREAPAGAPDSDTSGAAYSAHPICGTPFLPDYTSLNICLTFVLQVRSLLQRLQSFFPACAAEGGGFALWRGAEVIHGPLPCLAGLRKCREAVRTGLRLSSFRIREGEDRKLPSLRRIAKPRRSGPWDRRLSSCSDKSLRGCDIRIRSGIFSGPPRVWAAASIPSNSRW